MKFPIEPLMFLLKGKKDIVMAELGIFRCKSSLQVLNNFDVKKYYAIDIWKIYDDYNSKKSYVINYIREKGSDKCYQEALEKLREFSNVIIIRESTHKAVKYIKNRELDFCFIDANHEYDYVYKDIQLWLPKIKKGGILSGDDYYLSSVRKAVEDFFRIQTYKIYTAGKNYRNKKARSWYVIQNK